MAPPSQASDPEKSDPLAAFDGRKQSITTDSDTITVDFLKDADEALSFLENHPQSAQIGEEGLAILEDPVRLNRLVRKIDLTIAPLLAAVYFLQFLDKTTLSYTAVMGIRTDTHLKGQDYSNLSMLFYIVAPILVLIIAMWYKKEEQGRRVSWFYVCNSLTQIFGGCVAYGVSHVQGGFATWRIFYIAIGALTMVVGLLVAVFLPDSPVKARRFTDAEKVAALLRVKDNQSGTQNAHLKKTQVLEAFKDIRIYLVCLATLLSSIPNGGISNFQSILLTTFGYTPTQSLIYNTPTGALGAICVLLVGYLSDKWHDRSLVMLLAITPTILGAGLMIGLDPAGIPQNKAGLLAASFLTGTFGAAFMLLLAWNASNLAGHSKKVTANALTLVFFCVGNILGTQTFQDREAPGYRSGKISIVATLVALCFVVVGLRLYNDKLNRANACVLERMDEREREELRARMAFADRGDRGNVFFWYTH
ncbi:MAG: hypothetical protein Q9195_005227 [Heterodermia aff. obscurata]